MKAVIFPVYFAVLLAAQLIPAWASQGAIYRCGNEYLNDAAAAQARGCSLVEAGAITVTVTGTRVLSQVSEPAQARAVTAASATSAVSASAAAPASASSSIAPAAPKSTAWRADSAEQRARDRDALSILQAELSKAEALLAERQRDLADPQRHASRLPELQSSIGRHLSDIAGLKREISRLPR